MPEKPQSGHSQSTGNTIYNMITQGIGAITNIILDPILIFGLYGMPAMGVNVGTSPLVSPNTGIKTKLCSLK